MWATERNSFGGKPFNCAVFISALKLRFQIMKSIVNHYDSYYYYESNFQISMKLKNVVLNFTVNVVTEKLLTPCRCNPGSVLT